MIDRLPPMQPTVLEMPEHKNTAKIYDSAIDAWIAIMLMMTPILAAFIGCYLLWIGQAGDAAIMFASGAFTLLVTMAFAIPCRYTILDDALSIRCGLIFYQVPLNEIVSVEPTSTLRSGPALSMRRISVKTTKRTVILSPKDREGFISELTRLIS